MKEPHGLAFPVIFGVMLALYALAWWVHDEAPRDDPLGKAQGRMSQVFPFDWDDSCEELAMRFRIDGFDVHAAYELPTDCLERTAR